MDSFVATLFVALSMALPLSGQGTPPPQTARQALIEMFKGGSPDAFLKHLPDAARKNLPQNAEESYAFTIMQTATFGRPMVLSGEQVETFESGPNILVSEQDQSPDRMEVAVERDGVIGENEEIELSAHFFHDGQEISPVVIPRVVFVLRQEKAVWKLIDITASARVPLTDPDYLHGVLRRQQEANEATAKMRVLMIGNAEGGYATEHPELGYTCALTTLFAPPLADDSDDGSDDDNAEPPRVYYDPGQGNADWNGYHFAITGCDGTPASKYRITAAPANSDSGEKIFCGDESGTVKSTTDGNVSSCFTSGQVVSSPNDSPEEQNQTVELSTRTPVP
jgi:hypothetical protein